jgi:Nucleotidyltransferase domain
VAAQQELIDRVIDDLATDPRVRGLWLTGSFGAGTADEYSDVDMFVLVADAQLPPFVDAWLDHVVPLYQPLLARRMGPAPVFTHVLPGWLRWDLVVGGPGDLNDLDPDTVMELLNRDGVRPTPSFRPGVQTSAVLEMTEEFLRILGLLPVVVARGELVAAVAGSGLLRQLLTTLLRYRVEGPRLSGALHLSRVLPPDELAALAAMPPVYADRAAVIRAHVSCAAMFLPVARDLLGPDHPHALEKACWQHLQAELDVEPPV